MHNRTPQPERTPAGVCGQTTDAANIRFAASTFAACSAMNCASVTWRGLEPSSSEIVHFFGWLFIDFISQIGTAPRRPMSEPYGNDFLLSSLECEIVSRYINAMITPKDVRALRADMGLTKVQFAAELGRTTRQVLTYETDGSTIPRIVELALAALKAGITKFDSVW